MLKERDKKLLFYSWSYALLAACAIYACCGYGVLAYTEIRSYTLANDYNQFYFPSDFATGNTWIQGNIPINNNVTYITLEATGYVSNASVSLSGCQAVDMWYSGAKHGEGTFCWDFPDHSTYQLGEISLAIDSFYDSGGGTWGMKYPDTSTAFPVSGDFSFKRNGGSFASSAVDETNKLLFGDGASGFVSGEYHIYGGSSLPDAPVINDFTSDATCYSPGEAIVLESNVTGTVDTWLWEIYDSSDTSVFSSTDSVETIVDEIFAPGLYQVQLYVENTGGNDFLSKDNWLNITQAGTCTPMNNWTNPFPTQVTTIPTQQFYETMTMPPHIVTNISGINEEINKGIFANMSQGYRDYIDYVAEQANTTFTGTFRTLLSPVSLVVNSISGAIGLFSTAINSLTVYTTVPLAITAIVINYMPWQIVTLITAGIAIDAILIIILGR